MNGQRVSLHNKKKGHPVDDGMNLLERLATFHTMEFGSLAGSILFRGEHVIVNPCFSQAKLRSSCDGLLAERILTSRVSQVEL
jgi:hypothetical protein